MGIFSFFTRPTSNADETTPLQVTGAQAIELVRSGAQLVDVREHSEWRNGHAPQAIHLPLLQVATKATKKLSPQRPVVVMCASGIRSKAAATTLRSLGFNAANLKGGIRSWTNNGGPIT